VSITRPITATSVRNPARPRRRTLLTAGGATWLAALLSGCSGGSTGEAAGGGSAEDSSAADALRARAGRDSSALLARYDATAAAHPSLARRLQPLRQETAQHLQAFGGAPTSASASAAPPSPSTAATASPATAASAPAEPHSTPSSGRPATPLSAPSSAPPVPADAGQALAALARAERSTADSRATALLDAPPELARLLASVAACGAAHAFLLTAGGS
jgi:hypothetical protein